MTGVSRYYPTESVILNEVYFQTNDAVVEAFAVVWSWLGGELRLPLRLLGCYVTRVITGL